MGKISVNCEQCGQEFGAHKRNGGRLAKYCSRKCYVLNQKSWTARELETLQLQYPVEAKDVLLSLLSRWDWQAIKHKAYKLKIARDKYYWSFEEDQIVIENYTNASIDKIEGMLRNRTWEAIKARAQVLEVTGRFVPILSVNERKVLNIIDGILGETGVRNKRYNWLQSPKGYSLEIDGLYPKHNLAVEYQGEQHFKNDPRCFISPKSNSDIVRGVT